VATKTLLLFKIEFVNNNRVQNVLLRNKYLLLVD